MEFRLLLLAVLVIGPLEAAHAQTRLTIDEALARAMAANADVRAAAATLDEAEARGRLARAARLPSADLSETWQRGNQPVFVFSSLLAQRQFSASNFAIDALNHPGPVSHFHAALSVDAPIFDAVAGAHARSAGIGVEMAAVQGEQIKRDLAAAVVAAYGSVVRAVASRRVLAASLATATGDETLAEQRRDAGLVTEADVLQMRLHVAATRAAEIRATADEEVARARLNHLMGAPIGDTFVVEDVPESAAAVAPEVADPEAAAIAQRAEVRMATLQQSLAESTLRAARAAFLPRVSAMASWESSGGRWDARASGWIVGGVARVNLFRGFGDQARLAEARALQSRRRIERAGVEAAVRVDVREARARLDAARATVAVAEAAVAGATESHRIVRDRYESGLADVTALLRASEGVQAAEARRVNARVDVLVAGAAWRRAVGQ